jgi:multicomponent Na+:H+ antiporter subunit C
MSRDGLRCVLGLAILGSAVNLILFVSGRLVSVVPPLIPPGADELGAAANPLPQALVLTAIVIGLALLCYGLVLLLAIVRAAGTDDAIEMRIAEPIPSDPHKPPLSESLPAPAPTNGQVRP